MKITARILKLKGACIGQVALFKSLWPDGVQITEALCIAHASEFDWGWAANNLLSAPAWAEYERVRAPALAEYERVTASEFGRLAISCKSENHDSARRARGLASFL